MENVNLKTAEILERSVQINDGFTQTSADGVNMAFDSRFGILFCVYMPGPHGHYGESRGRISLTYFPASQPTNTKTIDVVSGREVYVPNIISLGDGKVRILYEDNSRADEDHLVYYQDFDYLSEQLTEAEPVMLRKDNGKTVPLTGSEQFAYLEEHGFYNHTYKAAEQVTIGSHTISRGEDGTLYGAITSYLAEPILYRSVDNMQTVEFFAICPYTAQYEMDYKWIGGKIHAVFRTDKAIDSIGYTCSEDDGKHWSEPTYFKDSIPCRPRLISYCDSMLISYNYFNDDTRNRPSIQQGRTAVRLVYGEKQTPVADLYSHYGIVNVCLIDILNDAYMAYSTSQLALEFQNGNPMVRGKDAIRFVKLGDLTPKFE
ncbi:MAG: hypothetical protein IJC17_04865 [Clostridia bacterium]|nr:hypothetical protein [Clostridia bacterium]